MTAKKTTKGNGSGRTFRMRVRARLAELDMTQDDLASKIDVGPSMISMVLRERVNRPDIVKAIERALSMEPSATAASAPAAPVST